MKEQNKSIEIHGVSIRAIGGVTILLAVALAFFAFTLAQRVDVAQTAAAEGERRNVACIEAIDDLQMASDYLTSQARTFVVTGNRANMDAYINELEVTNRRGKAVEILRGSFSSEQKAATALEKALSASDALAQTELAAMRLAANHYGIDDLPAVIEDASTAVYKRDGATQDDLELATSLVLGTNYDQAKQRIQTKVGDSSKALLSALEEELESSQMSVQTYLFQLRISVALLLCDLIVLVLALFMYVLKPLGSYVRNISKNESLKVVGASELYYLANAYNALYEDNARRIEQLRALAESDQLTGISNRNGYDSFLATHTRDIALLLIGIDNFQEYTVVYGRDTSDAMLVRLAHALTEAFRSTDFPCRIESDVFAVVMTNMSANLRDVIVSKIDQVNTMLDDESDDLPLVNLSVGAAFSTEGMTDQEIYSAAGSALQTARESDKNSIVFYGEENAE